jgi:hypothetical protein
MPSKIRMCVKPISRTNSSFVCSLRDGIVFVTLNILLMMSWDEYPRVLQIVLVRLFTRVRIIATRCLPEFFQDVQSSINLLFLAGLDHGLNLDRMRAVNNTEDIVPTHEPKTCGG